MPTFVAPLISMTLSPVADAAGLLYTAQSTAVVPSPATAVDDEDATTITRHTVTDLDPAPDPSTIYRPK